MTTIPTLNQLYTSIKADLEANLGVSIPLLGKNFIRVLAGVQAAKIKLLYLVLGNIQKNLAPDTADPESKGGTLERFGRFKLGRNPFQAIAAQYELTVTGSIGAVIKAKTTFKSDDTSLNPDSLFILDEEYTLVAISDTITVRALVPGIASRLDILNTLTSTAPIALVNSVATVSAEVTEPKAAEDITTTYRSAVEASYRLEPQGGAGADYFIWLRDAQGAKRGYIYVKSGTVDPELNFFVEATIADSTDGKGTPSPQLLLDVEEVVEKSPDTTLPTYDRFRRPMGVLQIHYLPVTIINVDIEIEGYVGITPTIETLLLNALTNSVNAIRTFVASADGLEEKNDIIDNFKVAGVIKAHQPTSVFTGIALKINVVAMLNYTFVDGNIPYLNS